MIAEYKLSIFKDIKEIVFKYFEVEFPITDTAITICDTYKMNIMLSDGLAAILRERGDIYNHFPVIYFSLALLKFIMAEFYVRVYTNI